MPSAFKYDVAISASDFDALTVTELKRRLEARLSKPIYAREAVSDDAIAIAATQRLFEKDARVVVVLLQRLWIDSPVTAAEVAGLKARIGKAKRKDVVIVPIDNFTPPTWLKGTVVKVAGDPTSSAVMDAIIDAVEMAGGTPKRLTDAVLAANAAAEDKAAQACTSFLTSQRALTLINRELDSLSAAVLKLCETPGTIPEGFAHETRRTPERYTVQIGPVGLSFSWIRGRSNSVADGQLLVIEWSGHLGGQPGATAPHAAMPALERVLQPRATSPEDWQWRRTDLDLCSYTTRDLAAQCVASALRRLPAPQPQPQQQSA